MMIKIKSLALIITILNFVLLVFGQQNSLKQSNESLMIKLFANNAPILDPKESLELLKSLKNSLQAADTNLDTRIIHLIKDLENLIEASENSIDKCKPDLFADYVFLMKHLDPKTYRPMVVLDYYNGAYWNDNIFNYLKYYHNEQHSICLDSFKNVIKNVSNEDLKLIEELAKSVRNGLNQDIAFPFIEPSDIERAVLTLIKPKLKDFNNKEKLLSQQGIAIFDKEFDKIKQICHNFQSSIGDEIQFAQQAYFSHLKERVEQDKLLINWAFYSDISELIDAVSETQKMEFLQSYGNLIDKKEQ